VKKPICKFFKGHIAIFTLAANGLCKNQNQLAVPDSIGWLEAGFALFTLTDISVTTSPTTETAIKIVQAGM
jgi:hypothetical protein